MNEQMKKKNNLKLFPIYKMFSWDLLFYYSIVFLFLTKIKGFSAAEVFFTDAFYPFFKMFFQIACVYITDLLGKRKSLLIGNLILSITILILIFCNSLLVLILINLLFAISYSIKDVCESTLLDDSIPECEKKPHIFSKIDGNGSSLFYYFDAISCLFTGFLFVINGYIPLVLCFLFCIISTIICYSLEEINNLPITSSKNLKNKIEYSSNYLKELKNTFKIIFKSQRLLSLLLCSSVFASVFSLFIALRSSLLVDLNVSEEYFGIILAFCSFVSAISSKKQYFFHKIFKNRVLTWFAFPISILFVFTGLVILCDLNPLIIFVTFGITIFIVSLIRGPYFTLIKRYFNSFSNPDVNAKIYSAKTIAEGLFRTVFYFLISFLLTFTNTAGCFTIFRSNTSNNFYFLIRLYETSRWA